MKEIANFINETDIDLADLEKLANKLLPYAQDTMGFEKPITIVFLSDQENSANPLGKTAYYDPSEGAVSLFVDGRHPKDILRSLSHELVHHTQNGMGMFDNIGPLGPGYAQEDELMREIERQAYEMGNMCFRDWEDHYKQSQEWQLMEGIADRIKSALTPEGGWGQAAKDFGKGFTGSFKTMHPKRGLWSKGGPEGDSPLAGGFTPGQRWNAPMPSGRTEEEEKKAWSEEDKDNPDAMWDSKPDYDDSSSKWLKWIFSHVGRENVKKAYFTAIYEEDMSQGKKMRILQMYAERIRSGRWKDTPDESGGPDVPEGGEGGEPAPDPADPSDIGYADEAESDTGESEEASDPASERGDTYEEWATSWADDWVEAGGTELPALDGLNGEEAAMADSDGDTRGLDSDDATYKKAIDLVTTHQNASAPFLQRELGIGYNRARALLDAMEEDGIIGPLPASAGGGFYGSTPREIFKAKEEPTPEPTPVVADWDPDRDERGRYLLEEPYIGAKILSGTESIMAKYPNVKINPLGLANWLDDLQANRSEDRPGALLPGRGLAEQYQGIRAASEKDELSAAEHEMASSAEDDEQARIRGEEDIAWQQEKERLTKAEDLDASWTPHAKELAWREHQPGEKEPPEGWVPPGGHARGQNPNLPATPFVVDYSEFEKAMEEQEVILGADPWTEKAVLADLAQMLAEFFPINIRHSSGAAAMTTEIPAETDDDSVSLSEELKLRSQVVKAINRVKSLHSTAAKYNQLHGIRNQLVKEEIRKTTVRQAILEVRKRTAKLQKIRFKKLAGLLSEQEATDWRAIAGVPAELHDPGADSDFDASGSEFSLGQESGGGQLDWSADDIATVRSNVPSDMSDDDIRGLLDYLAPEGPTDTNRPVVSSTVRSKYTRPGLDIEGFSIDDPSPAELPSASDWYSSNRQLNAGDLGSSVGLGELGDVWSDPWDLTDFSQQQTDPVGYNQRMAAQRSLSDRVANMGYSAPTTYQIPVVGMDPQGYWLMDSADGGHTFHIEDPLGPAYGMTSAYHGVGSPLAGGSSGLGLDQGEVTPYNIDPQLYAMSQEPSQIPSTGAPSDAGLWLAQGDDQNLEFPGMPAGRPYEATGDSLLDIGALEYSMAGAPNFGEFSGSPYTYSATYGDERNAYWGPDFLMRGWGPEYANRDADLEPLAQTLVDRGDFDSLRDATQHLRDMGVGEDWGNIHMTKPGATSEPGRSYQEYIQDQTWSNIAQTAYQQGISPDPADLEALRLDLAARSDEAMPSMQDVWEDPEWGDYTWDASDGSWNYSSLTNPGVMDDNWEPGSWADHQVRERDFSEALELDWTPDRDSRYTGDLEDVEAESGYGEEDPLETPFDESRIVDLYGDPQQFESVREQHLLDMHNRAMEAAYFGDVRVANMYMDSYIRNLNEGMITQEFLDEYHLPTVSELQQFSQDGGAGLDPRDRMEDEFGVQGYVGGAAASEAERWSMLGYDYQTYFTEREIWKSLEQMERYNFSPEQGPRELLSNIEFDPEHHPWAFSAPLDEETPWIRNWAVPFDISQELPDPSEMEQGVTYSDTVRPSVQIDFTNPESVAQAMAWARDIDSEHNLGDYTIRALEDSLLDVGSLTTDVVVERRVERIEQEYGERVAHLYTSQGLAVPLSIQHQVMGGRGAGIPGRSPWDPLEVPAYRDHNAQLSTLLSAPITDTSGNPMIYRRGRINVGGFEGGSRDPWLQGTRQPMSFLEMITLGAYTVETSYDHEGRWYGPQGPDEQFGNRLENFRLDQQDMMGITAMGQQQSMVEMHAVGPGAYSGQTEYNYNPGNTVVELSSMLAHPSTAAPVGAVYTDPTDGEEYHIALPHELSLMPRSFSPRAVIEWNYQEAGRGRAPSSMFYPATAADGGLIDLGAVGYLEQQTIDSVWDLATGVGTDQHAIAKNVEIWINRNAEFFGGGIKHPTLNPEGRWDRWGRDLTDRPHMIRVDRDMGTTGGNAGVGRDTIPGWLGLFEGDYIYLSDAEYDVARLYGGIPASWITGTGWGVSKSFDGEGYIVNYEGGFALGGAQCVGSCHGARYAYDHTQLDGRKQVLGNMMIDRDFIVPITREAAQDIPRLPGSGTDAYGHSDDYSGTSITTRDLGWGVQRINTSEWGAEKPEYATADAAGRARINNAEVTRYIAMAEENGYLAYYDPTSKMLSVQLDVQALMDETGGRLYGELENAYYNAPTIYIPNLERGSIGLSFGGWRHPGGSSGIMSLPGGGVGTTYTGEYPYVMGSWYLDDYGGLGRYNRHPSLFEEGEPPIDPGEDGSYLSGESALRYIINRHALRKVSAGGEDIHRTLQGHIRANLDPEARGQNPWYHIDPLSGELGTEQTYRYDHWLGVLSETDETVYDQVRSTHTQAQSDAEGENRYIEQYIQTPSVRHISAAFMNEQDKAAHLEMLYTRLLGDPRYNGGQDWRDRLPVVNGVPSMAGLQTIEDFVAIALPNSELAYAHREVEREVTRLRTQWQEDPEAFSQDERVRELRTQFAEDDSATPTPDEDLFWTELTRLTHEAVNNGTGGRLAGSQKAPIYQWPYDPARDGERTDTFVCGTPSQPDRLCIRQTTAEARSENTGHLHILRELDSTRRSPTISGMLGMPSMPTEGGRPMGDAGIAEIHRRFHTNTAVRSLGIDIERWLLSQTIEQQQYTLPAPNIRSDGSPIWDRNLLMRDRGDGQTWIEAACATVGGNGCFIDPNGQRDFYGSVLPWDMEHDDNGQPREPATRAYISYLAQASGIPSYLDQEASSTWYPGSMEVNRGWGAVGAGGWLTIDLSSGESPSSPTSYAIPVTHEEASRYQARYDASARDASHARTGTKGPADHGPGGIAGAFRSGEDVTTYYAQGAPQTLADGPAWWMPGGSNVPPAGDEIDAYNAEWHGTKEGGYLATLGADLPSFQPQYHWADVNGYTNVTVAGHGLMYGSNTNIPEELRGTAVEGAAQSLMEHYIMRVHARMQTQSWLWSNTDVVVMDGTTYYPIEGQSGSMLLAFSRAQEEETEYLMENHPELYTQLQSDMAEVHYRMGVRSIGAWLEEDDGLLAHYLSPDPRAYGSDPIFRAGLLETYPNLAIRQMGSDAYAEEMRRLQLAAVPQQSVGAGATPTDIARQEEAEAQTLLASIEHLQESGGIGFENAEGQMMVVGRITHYIPRDAMIAGPGTEEWNAWRAYASGREGLQTYADNPAAYVADVNDYWSIGGRPTQYSNGGTSGNTEARMEALRKAYPNAFRELRENLSINRMKKLLTEELSKVFENFSS